MQKNARVGPEFGLSWHRHVTLWAAKIYSRTPVFRCLRCFLFKIWQFVTNCVLFVCSLISTILSSLDQKGFDVKALRAFRVLRPLRLVSGVPSKCDSVSPFVFASTCILQAEICVFKKCKMPYIIQVGESMINSWALRVRHLDRIHLKGMWRVFSGHLLMFTSVCCGAMEVELSLPGRDWTCAWPTNCFGLPFCSWWEYRFFWRRLWKGWNFDKPSLRGIYHS